MTKIVIAFALGFCGLAGFSSAAGAAEKAHYICADKTELTATFRASPASVVLVFAGSGKEIRLPQVISADGGRYSEGDTEFWIKGRDATLTLGQSKTTCKS